VSLGEGWFTTTRPDWPRSHPFCHIPHRECGGLRRLCGEPGEGWRDDAARGSVILVYGPRRVPTVFWGTLCQGPERLRLPETSTALILMGDWCGSAQKGRHRNQRKHGRGLVGAEDVNGAHATVQKKVANNGALPLDRSLLMGDPLPSRARGRRGLHPDQPDKFSRDQEVVRGVREHARPEASGALVGQRPQDTA